MRQLSFGRHRGADWLSRSAFPLATQQPAFERFVLRLHDPKHPRALWACLALFRSEAGTAEARCSAIYFDGTAKTTLVAEETWPLERAAVDDERGGLGVGECQIWPDASHGLVRGNGFAISWDVALAQLAPAQKLLPKAWLYRGDRVGQKASLPTPACTVHAGRIELWHALGRHANKTRLDTQGWRGSLDHSWGTGTLQVHAAAHAHALEGAADGAYFHAVGASTQLWKTFALQPQLGVLAVDGRAAAPQTFAGFSALRGPGPLHTEPHLWRLELVGNKTTFVGEVRSEPQLTARVAGFGGGSLYVSELATLEATWTPPAAAARTVHATQVSLETLG